MAPPSRRRGIQDIRTMAGRPSTPGSNHRAYMRLATLEMERMRREQEYRVAAERADAALNRVNKLQSEIRDIAAMIFRDSAKAKNSDQSLTPTVKNVSPANAASTNQEEQTPQIRYGIRRLTPASSNRKANES